MGLIASLDIGSEKMVMAVAAEENGECRLAGIKMIALQGVQDGIITDKSKVKSYIQYLIRELAKDKPIDCLNVALSGKALRISEHKVNVPIRKKVRESDIAQAENRCTELVLWKGDELVDIIPVTYAVDRGNYVTDPVGMTAKSLDVRFRVYLSDAAYLTEIRELLEACGVENVEFFPPVRAYMEALDVYDRSEPFALIDMGATHTEVVLFRDGGLRYEISLPLGAQTIDHDIVRAFSLEDIQLAKKMKHQYGVAIRAVCKNEKIDIPDVKKRIEKRDLAKVIQCRMEELLEGAVYQIQQWRFNDPKKEIVLTGGGSRLAETELLLGRLSGQKVIRAKAAGIKTTNEDILEAPSCLVALGLLLCEHSEPLEEKGGWGSWLNSIFR